MKIVNVICAYNELEYLPYVIDAYRHDGIDVFVLDNYSNDGTWEYLRSERVPCRRVETDGAFDLRTLQRARLDAYQELQADWVIYGDADEFIVSEAPIRDVIESAAANGYTGIRFRKLEFYNTGEQRPFLDPREHFFYFAESYTRFGGVERVHAYRPNLRYDGDFVCAQGSRVQQADGELWNYGATKSPESREETYRRRRLAWQRGLNHGYGAHYVRHRRRNWLWNRDELADVHQTESWRAWVRRRDES